MRITAAAGTHITQLLFANLSKVGKRSQRDHSKFLCHTFVYCRIFAPAAPRRARVLISVPFSGLLLAKPVRITGLVGLYPANNLIRRRPILERNYQHDDSPFGLWNIPVSVIYRVLPTVSRVSLFSRVGYPRVTEPFAKTSRGFGFATCMS